MRLGHLPEPKRLALALGLVGLVVLIWVFWSPSAGLLAAGIVGFVVLVRICLWVLPSRLVARDTAAAELAPEQRASAVNSARTTLVQGLAGLAALAGILVAWQQLQSDREQLRTNQQHLRIDQQNLQEQLTLARQGQVAERFTRAVGQLGNATVGVRLGGIYALEQIAKQSAEDRLQVFEVLCAYVREHDLSRWVDTQLEGKSYLLGDAFSVADAYLFTVTNWAKPVGIDLSGLGDMVDLGAMLEGVGAFFGGLGEFLGGIDL